MNEEKLLTANSVGAQGSRQDESTQPHYNLRTTPAQRFFGGQAAKTNTDPSQAEAKPEGNKTVSYATIASATQRSLQLV